MVAKKTADAADVFVVGEVPSEVSELDIMNAAGSVVKEFETWSEAELNSIETFDQWMKESGLSEADLTFMGSNWTPVDKKELVNRAVGFIKWKFSAGDFGPFVIAYGITRDTNERILITDGSTGIYKQLLEVTNMRIARGHATPIENLFVPNGLRVSDYYLDEETGHALPKGETSERRARTYYLA